MKSIGIFAILRCTETKVAPAKRDELFSDQLYCNQNSNLNLSIILNPIKTEVLWLYLVRKTSQDREQMNRNSVEEFLFHLYNTHNH